MTKIKPWLLLFTTAIFLSGCGQQSLTTSTSSNTKESSASLQENHSPGNKTVLADDSFSNLQLDTPPLPVYDSYTLAQRRTKGLITALPMLKNYKTGKVVYLTFDDGPDNKNTPAILDILADENVKATFFVTGRHAELYPDMLRRIYKEGHAIGNHSYDHDYSRLYPSAANYIKEMEKTDGIIFSAIGVRPLITRAPGGTVGHFTKAYLPALRENGYTEFGWNVSSADAAPNHPVAQDFIDNVLSQIDNPAVSSHPTILMHCSEGHEETVKALPAIIKLLKERGYIFGVITPMTPSPW